MSLFDCYNALEHNEIAGHPLLHLPNRPIEPYEAVQRVHDYRWFFKGRKGGVVLLAESHLFVNEEELNINIDIPAWGGHLPPNYPAGCARFVYCLGYGENGILANAIPGNNGTYQFWKIFYSCLHYPNGNADFFNPITVTGEPDIENRINNKVDVLLEMRRRGIWLVDASIIAIAGMGWGAHYDQILQVCWDDYVEETLEEVAPSFVIVIGKGVHAALHNQLNASFGGRYLALEQPQARLPAGLQPANLRLINALCNRFAPPLPNQ